MSSTRTLNRKASFVRGAGKRAYIDFKLTNGHIGIPLPALLADQVPPDTVVGPYDDVLPIDPSYCLSISTEEMYRKWSVKKPFVRLPRLELAREIAQVLAQAWGEDLKMTPDGVRAHASKHELYALETNEPAGTAWVAVLREVVPPLPKQGAKLH